MPDSETNNNGAGWQKLGLVVFWLLSCIGLMAMGGAGIGVPGTIIAAVLLFILGAAGLWQYWNKIGKK